MLNSTKMKLARVMGSLWFRWDSRHRGIVQNNLTMAFGDELTCDQKTVISRNTFIHLANVLLDLPSLLNLNKDNLDKYITFTGLENLYGVLGKGKGVLVMASHFGNWELMSLAFSLRFRPFHVVVRPLDNAFLNRLIDHIRCRGGNRTIPKIGSVRDILRLLRQDDAVALLIDQNADWYEAVFVPFFREIACTNKALATLALRTGAAVLPVYNFRLPDGRYQMVFEPEVQLIRTGDSMLADIEENTALFNRIIEGYIRKHPEQWFWLHQRWKTRNYQPWPR